MKTKIYLQRCYEAYMASECGISVCFSVPRDTQYYKHEILSETEIDLAECYELDKEETDIYREGKHCPIYTEKRNGVLTTFLLDGVTYKEVALIEWQNN